MRIIQLIQKTQLRGAEMFACQLSNQLLLNNHEVKLLCLLEGNAQLPFKGQIVNLKRPLSKRFIDVNGWRMLAKEIADFKPDIIQANAGDTLKFAVFSKLLFRWRTPIIFRNANKVSDFVKSLPKKWLNGFFVGRVQHVVSVSELCKLDFIKTYSYPVEDITTVPIGIEIQTIKKELPYDLLDVFKGAEVLLNVGSLVPEKNQLGMLRIMENVVKNNPNAKLILIGDGKQRDVIKENISTAALDGHVYLAGFRNDVLSVMSNAKVFVLPSLIEGLPGVILEAQYCKIPVIAYDVGGISEVIEDNKTGWLIEKGDEAHFSRAVIEVLVDSVKRERLVDNAYHQVISKYDNREIAERFVRVYDKVVTRSVRVART